MTYILAIDQGTTSSRAILFDENARTVGVAQQEFTQYFPNDGWVEHDPEEIWQSTLQVMREVVRNAGISAAEIESIGITNQRETTIIWERSTGEPVYPAIVWQDRRTAEYCARLTRQGLSASVSEKTGLLIDPYFSATKVRWILDEVAGVREKAEAGELAFGTVDSFLLWRLTSGVSHKTDATNASRTMMFNIHDQAWDLELLDQLSIPAAVLPEVLDSCADFGDIDEQWLGARIPITGIAGDQQAALVGQCCFSKGLTKSTYGTGCFVIMNTGHEPLRSRNRLLTTVAYRINGETTYGIEGSIFIAGAAVQWIRDGLKLIGDAAESERIAERTNTSSGVYLVPSFTGLGAPYWDPDARGAILGLTRDSGIDEIVVATLQSVGFQSRDLLLAMGADGAVPTELRIDGGMVNNNWVAQFLADILQLPVDRPDNTETTALGACYLSGLHTGRFSSFESLAQLRRSDRVFKPQMTAAEASRLYAGWQAAVKRVVKSGNVS